VIWAESGEKVSVRLASVSKVSEAVGWTTITLALSTVRPPKELSATLVTGWIASATMRRAGPVGLSHVTAAPAATTTGSNPRSNLRAREWRCSTGLTDWSPK
jgi:hypothetical protein